MPKAKAKDEPVIPVPESDLDCNHFMGAIGELQRERARLHLKHDTIVAKAKTALEAKDAPLRDQLTAQLKGLRQYCEKNRARLTKDEKIKTHSFIAGDVGWRLSPPKVVVRGVAKIIELMSARRLTRFIRVKEELNKEAILDDPKAVEGIKGLSIAQDEVFFVKPFKSEIEEIVP